MIPLVVTAAAALGYAISTGAVIELQRSRGSAPQDGQHLFRNLYAQGLGAFYGVQGAWAGSVLGVPVLLTGNVPGAVAAGGAGAAAGWGFGQRLAAFTIATSDQVWGEGGPFGLWELLP